MDKKIFKVRLTALTPVHIGAGLKLRKGVDFVVHNGKLHLLSPEKIWKVIGRDQYEPWLKAIENNRQEEFLKALDPSYQRFAALSIPVKFSQQGNVPTDFHRHITSPTRGVYVPGSSIKGTLLTLFIRKKILKKEVSINLSQRGDSRYRNGRKEFNFNDSKIKKAIWGSNPNTSLGRFIRFSDLHAVADFENKTEVHWIRVFNRLHNGWGYKADSLLAECLPVGWQAEGTLTLLPEWYQQNRNFTFRKNQPNLPEANFLHSHKNLVTLIQEQSLSELEKEINELQDEQLNSFNEGSTFINKLMEIKDVIEKGAVVMRVGGHVGWNFTTGGWVRLLDKNQLPDEDKIRKVIQRRDYYNKMLFWPKTRKTTSQGLPLGFVKLELTSIDNQ